MNNRNFPPFISQLATPKGVPSHDKLKSANPKNLANSCFRATPTHPLPVPRENFTCCLTKSKFYCNSFDILLSSVGSKHYMLINVKCQLASPRNSVNFWKKLARLETRSVCCTEQRVCLLLSPAVTPRCIYQHDFTKFSFSCERALTKCLEAITAMENKARYY